MNLNPEENLDEKKPKARPKIYMTAKRRALLAQQNREKESNGNGEKQEQSGGGGGESNSGESPSKRMRIRKKWDSFFVFPPLKKKSHLKVRKTERPHLLTKPTTKTTTMNINGQNNNNTKARGRPKKNSKKQQQQQPQQNNEVNPKQTTSSQFTSG